MTKFSAIQIYSYAENQQGELLNGLRQRLEQRSEPDSELSAGKAPFAAALEWPGEPVPAARI